MTPSRRAVLTSLKLADLSMVAVAFLVALTVTTSEPGASSWVEVLQIRIKLQNVLFVVGYVGLWHLVLRACGLYHSYRLSAASKELRDLAIAVTLATLPLIVLSPLLDFEYASSAFFVTFAATSFVGLGLERRLLRAIGRGLRRTGRNLRNAIVVGSGDAAFELTSKLVRRSDFGYHIVGVVEYDDSGNGNGAGADGVIARVEALIHHQPIDEVFVTASSKR